MFKVFKVSGTSMSPTLVPGDYVLATNLFRKFVFKNTIIIFFDKYSSFVIKRVLKNNNKTVMLKNDNEETSSIFCNEPLNKNQIKYRVLLKLRLSKKKKLTQKFF